MSINLLKQSKVTVHGMVNDLRDHVAWIYWVDLLFSTIVFWVCLAYMSAAFVTLSVYLLCVVGGTFALYRAVMFIHEIAHFSRRTLPGFELTWNALIGWPVFFPSFFIRYHLSHHRTASYGTNDDPEYFSLTSKSPSDRRFFLVSTSLTPFFLLFRASVLVPISWLHAPLRRWVWCQCSHVKMNIGFNPAAHLQNQIQAERASDVINTAYSWLLISFTLLDLLSWQFVFNLLLVMALASFINGWRTLLAHRYSSLGLPIDHLSQLSDSTTFCYPFWLGELLAPVGQRFHAAHHLFPYLPYHSLPEADRRLRLTSWIGSDVYKETLR